MPAEYQGGIGDAGVAALKAFVDAGGTLVAFDQASDLVIDRFGDVFTHVHDVVQGLDQKTFYCPGSVLKIAVDPNAPAAFGMAPEAAAFFAGSRGFETDDPSVVSVARYAPAGELLMSGWLLGADKLAGRHALRRGAVRKGPGIALRLPPPVPRPAARDVQVAVQCAVSVTAMGPVGP